MGLLMECKDILCMLRTGMEQADIQMDRERTMDNTRQALTTLRYGSLNMMDSPA